MELREPRKKPRVKLQPEQSYPLIFDDDGNLIIFTAHLSAMGTCIGEPEHMAIVHSMGFFGKASLSRSFPCFGRARYGVLSVIRNRQWIRRVNWVKEVKELNQEFQQEDENKQVSLEVNTGEIDSNYKPAGASCSTTVQKSVCDLEPKESLNVNIKKENNGRESIVGESRKFGKLNEIEILESSVNKAEKENLESEQVILDIAEDEEVQEISKSEEILEKSDDSLEEEIELDHSSDLECEQSPFQGDILVLPDSESENEDYLKDIRPRIEKDSFPVRETLHLTFEESFFLMYALGCLQVIDIQGKIISLNEAWHHFCSEDIFFIQKYVVYHYFRSKGWVVKPGMKYGGDFLLYKQGPPFYHASYIVIIDVLDAETLKRIEEKALRRMTIRNLVGIERLAEAAGKEILLAQVMWPKIISRTNNTETVPNLSHFTVREILCRRWKMNNSIDESNLSKSDEDSS